MGERSPGARPCSRGANASARPGTRILLLALAWASCGPIVDAGVARQGAIRDGQVARSCDLPAVLSVEDKCSAVLLSPRLVAYAGHCGLDIHTMQLARDGNVEALSLTECRSPYQTPPNPDVAFCVLDAPVSGIPMAPILPECLRPSDWSGTEVLVAGYGLDGPTGTAGTKKFFSGTIESYTDTGIAIDVGDGGTCSGDSGGPVYVKRGDSWYALGVVSHGDASGCDTAMVFATPLAPWQQWVEDQLGVRASPCYLAGGWAPGVRCGLLAQDAPSSAGDAPCIAASAVDTAVGPCPGLALPATESSLGPAPSFVAFTPSDGAVIPAGTAVDAGVTIDPAGADVGVNVTVTSPDHLTWSAYREISPYRISVTAAAEGTWMIHATMSDEQGRTVAGASTFTVQRAKGGGGCSASPATPPDRCGPIIVTLAMLAMLATTWRWRSRG